jgi:hypothetical protein
MQSSSSNVPVNRKEQPQIDPRKPGPPSPRRKWRQRGKAFLKRIGLPTTIVGIVTTFFALFPHLTVTEPVTMNPGQTFSKYMTLNNEGVLPVFRVRCGIAVIKIWTDQDSGIIGTGDFTSRFEHTSCYAGTLSPGDSFTFTLENVLATAGAQITEADFAVVISYVPIFPPLPMDKCVHFVLHQSSSGEKYWFRSPGHCALFPWLHF